MELRGNAVSRGIAVGQILRYVPFQPQLASQPLQSHQVSAALAAYDQAKARAQAELEGLAAALEAGEAEQAKVVKAHRDILLDPAMEEEIRDLVTGKLLSPDAAAAQVYDTYAQVLGRSKNPRMRERASDLADVKNRLLRCWAGVPERRLSRLDRPVIVAADDLYPSDTAALDRTHVLGIVTQVGGATSHTAIIARSYGIPAVLGVAGLMEQVEDGQLVVLDGEEGKLLTAPTRAQQAAYQARGREVAAELAETAAWLDAKPVTRDGTRVQIHLNVASADARELSGASCADGCGLFRTEFLYLKGDRPPDEEAQYQAYRRVLSAFAGRPVILRTMDIGGDKQMPGLELPMERNPFLGLRGLRLSLDRPALFRTQLRAALRASAHGRLKLMFPMVGGLEELRTARAAVAAAGAELDREGLPWDHELEVGIMVEIPSIAEIADLAVAEVDFASVGTNDLTQYLCAADRMEPGVSAYYQSYHPALFRVLARLAQTFRAAGKELSVCGELGGDPLALPALVGMGIRKLSMGLAAIPAAKRTLSRLDLPGAEQLAERICRCGTDAEIRAALREFAARAAGGA